MKSKVSRRQLLAGGATGLTWSLTRGLPALANSPIENQANGRPKSVILLWLAGGISHIDSWDVKPDAPREVRGPFATIPTSVPGLYAVNSAHIVNGTLNVNETIELADRALGEIDGDRRSGGGEARKDAA